MQKKLIKHICEKNISQPGFAKEYLNSYVINNKETERAFNDENESENQEDDMRMEYIVRFRLKKIYR